MRKQTSIEDKFQVLQSILSEQQTFIMADVEVVFPDLSKATRYWLVSEFVKLGYYGESGGARLHLMSG
jgi:hypothetical protein